MPKVIHAVDVEITGELDPSLAKAIGLTEAQLKRLQSSAKVFNSLMGKISPEVGRGMYEVSRHTQKAESAFSRMAKNAKRSFHEIAEAGAKAGESIHKAFEPFHRGMEKIGEVTGITGLLGGIGGAIAAEEFTKGAFEVRAEREVLQNQMRSMTEAMGKAGLDKQIDTMIRNMEGRETPVRYDELMKTSTLLLGADRNRFGDVESVHKMLGKIADISRSPEAFGLASASITKMVAEGTVDAAHLRELSIDTGFQFREGMAKALQVTPAQMAEMMKKHKFTGTQLLDALFKSIDEATGPGGPAHGHALAQLAGLSGIQERFLSHWKDFQESFGMQLENFISPIADKVFALLTPAALTHAFDGLSRMTTATGEAIVGIVGKLEASGVIDKLKTIGETVTGGMGSFFDKLFTQVQDPISGVHDVLTASGKAMLDELSGKMIDNIKKTLDAVQATVSFIRDNFQTIKTIAEAIALSWGAMKVFDFASKLGEMVKAIGGAIFTVGTATINVTGAVETGGAAGIGIGAAGTALSGLARAGIGTGMIFGQAAIADTMRPMETNFLQKLGLSADNAAKLLDGTFAKISVLDGKFGGFGTALDNTIQSLASMAAKIIALPFAGMANSIAQFSAAVGSAMSATSAAEAAAKTYSHAPGAAQPRALPGPTPHAAGGIFTRPHIGLVAERGPEAIIPLGRGGGLGASVTVNAPITVNGGDRSLDSILSNHAESIARAVEKALADHQMRMATV